MKLKRFRNTHPAFGSNEPEVSVGREGRLLRIRRHHDGHDALLEVNLKSRHADITCSDGGKSEHFRL